MLVIFQTLNFCWSIPVKSTFLTGLEMQKQEIYEDRLWCVTSVRANTILFHQQNQNTQYGFIIVTQLYKNNMQFSH